MGRRLSFKGWGRELNGCFGSCSRRIAGRGERVAGIQDRKKDGMGVPGSGEE